MPNGRDTMAQAVYLAQLEAARGDCKCNTCRILRKASRAMTQAFLNPQGVNPSGVKEATELAQSDNSEIISLAEEEED